MIATPRLRAHFPLDKTQAVFSNTEMSPNWGEVVRR